MAVSELYDSRNLLRNFVSRDLSVRYKGSALGILWSLLNPLMMMLVFTAVFSVLLRFSSSLPKGHYPIWFLAGFLPWSFLATALPLGTSSLVANGALIQKVYFPREVLPLSMTIANLINFGIAVALLLPFAAWTVGISVLGVIVLIPITAALFLFAAGLVMLCSALNVYFRDVEFLLGIVLTVWFYLTPIIYPLTNPAVARHARWFDLNPFVPFSEAYRDALYLGVVPSLERTSLCIGIGVVTFVICYAAFNRLKVRIAEEL
jgi:ABC-2 type transport system permease protein